MEQRAHGEVHWSPCYVEGRSADTYVRVEVDVLGDLIRFDLSHIYFTLGDLLLQQHRGAPMGGYVSATYAIVACTYDEYRFHATLPANIRLFARRYIDDLLTIIAVPTGVIGSSDPVKCSSSAHYAFQLQQAHDTMHRLQHECYHPSLQLDAQVPDANTTDEIEWQFLDSVVHVESAERTSRPYLHTTPLNKNWAHLLTTGEQRIIKYQHWFSFSSVTSKLGVLKSALLRLHHSSTHSLHFCIAVLQLRAELVDRLSYPRWAIRRALASCFSSTQHPAFHHALHWLEWKDHIYPPLA